VPGKASSENRVGLYIVVGAILLFGIIVAVVLTALYLYRRGPTMPSPTSTSRLDIYVTEMHMAMDDGRGLGQPGDETSTFTPSDRTIHCIATLNKAKTGTKLKFAWRIVDVYGHKDEKIFEFDYTTKPSEKVVGGHVTYSVDWPKGRYKCEVYVEGNLDKTVEFTVE